MYCIQCGANNPPEARFCYACGATMARPPAAQGQPRNPTAPPRPTPPRSPQGRPLNTSPTNPAPAGTTRAPTRPGNGGCLIFVSQMILLFSAVGLLIVVIGYLSPLLILGSIGLLVLAWKKPGLVTRIANSRRLAGLPAWARTTPMRFAAVAAAVVIPISALFGTWAYSPTNPTPTAVSVVGTPAGTSIAAGAVPSATIAATAGSPSPPPMSTTAALAEATTIPLSSDTPTPSPTATPVPPSPTPPPQKPTPTPKPPTPTPAPVPVLDVAGRLTPTSYVGGLVTLTITVKNVGPGDIGNLTINVSQGYIKHFVLVRTEPASENDESWGSRIFFFGPLKQGETQTYMIVLSPKEAGEFRGPVLFFDRSIGSGIGKQLKFVNGNEELAAKTTVLAR